LLVEDKTIKYGYMNSSQDSSTIVHVSVFLIPFFSLVPLFFISKKAKTRMYVYISSSKIISCLQDILNPAFILVMFITALTALASLVQGESRK